jgi:hypothetical protein
MTGRVASGCTPVARSLERRSTRRQDGRSGPRVCAERFPRAGLIHSGSTAIAGVVKRADSGADGLGHRRRIHLPGEDLRSNGPVDSAQVAAIVRGRLDEARPWRHALTGRRRAGPSDSVCISVTVAVTVLKPRVAATAQAVVIKNASASFGLPAHAIGSADRGVQATLPGCDACVQDGDASRACSFAPPVVAVLSVGATVAA